MLANIHSVAVLVVQSTFRGFIIVFSNLLVKIEYVVPYISSISMYYVICILDFETVCCNTCYKYI